MHFSKRRSAVALVTLVGAGLLACVDLGPGSGGSLVLWELDGFSNTQPVIAGPRVVVAFESGRVAAYDRASGSVRWSRDFQGPFLGKNLLRLADRIIVPEYELHAVDATTGNLLWTYAGVTGTAGVNTPGLAGDTLFVADAGSGVAVALDANTGAVLWSRDLGEALFTPAVSSDLVLYGTRSYLGGPRQGPYGAGHVIALDRYTGQERWRFALPDHPDLVPSGGAVNGGRVVGDRLVIGSMASRVYALRLTDGSLLWEHAGASPTRGADYTSAPVVAAGNAVFFRGDALVEALRVEDGVVAWSTRLGFGNVRPAPQACAPYICAAEGRIWVLDDAGAVRWSHGGGESGFAYLADPAVDSAGRVFLGGVRGGTTERFFALRPPLALGPTP